MKGSAIYYRGVLKRIARTFQGLIFAELSKLEKDVLLTALLALDWRMEADTFGQIDLKGDE